MAFNFNWSPLTADSDFYTRTRELLTAALNKSPKPPIIVDDILVTELNLGSVPPELEILEVGDLAEDRFRGIFKMCYSGDAFFTLKTRVQLNPLNTYLSGKPDFASPRPLAAASGLTIPIQLTLSDITLSSFIVLVFSRQKGITLVFRNDPLESLKVSSSFDYIPFVREYLQKEIDKQLRTILIDELPAIIHRLSLRLWVPEYREQADSLISRSGAMPADEKAIDPLATPPQDPVDSWGRVLDPSDTFSLETGSEPHSLFSQKNLLRLAALTDSQRTLSLFTPSIRDVVFRAWAGAIERGDGEAATPTPSLSRSHSQSLSSSSASFTFSDTASTSSILSRQTSISTVPSTASFHSLPSWQHKPHASRKRKHRIINLRHMNIGADQNVAPAAVNGETISSEIAAVHRDVHAENVSSEEEDEMITPPESPKKLASSVSHHGKSTNLKKHKTTTATTTPTTTIPIPQAVENWERKLQEDSEVLRSSATQFAPNFSPPTQGVLDKSASSSYFASRPAPFVSNLPPSYTPIADPGMAIFGGSPLRGISIAEQAFMMKMASEIARRVTEERERVRFASASAVSADSHGDRVRRDDSTCAGTSKREWGWGDVMERVGTPPPAYGSSS